MSSEEREWVPAYLEKRFASIEWEDCSLGFTCACGESDLMVDGEGEPVTCPRCRRQFRLVTHFESQEAEKSE